MMRRAVLLTWCFVCLAVAAGASLQMFVTHAPAKVVRDVPPGCEAEIQRAELSGIRRARDSYDMPVFLASSLLTVNSVALVSLGWRR